MLVIGISVGYLCWWHWVRRLELASYESGSTTATVTYIYHWSPLGLSGVGGIWCDAKSADGEDGRWLESSITCDMPVDWTVRIRPSAAGLEVVKRKNDDPKMEEIFRFDGERIIGPHLLPHP